MLAAGKKKMFLHLAYSDLPICQIEQEEALNSLPILFSVLKTQIITGIASHCDASCELLPNTLNYLFMQPKAQINPCNLWLEARTTTLTIVTT